MYGARWQANSFFRGLVRFNLILCLAFSNMYRIITCQPAEEILSAALPRYRILRHP